MAVTKIDHIELHREPLPTSTWHSRSASRSEFGPSTTATRGVSAPGENQPVFEIHRVGGEEAIGVNHIAFQVADVAAARKELQAQGLDASCRHAYARATAARC